MPVSQIKFRGNEAARLSPGQLYGFLRQRTSVERRLELIQDAFPDDRNGILRPFKPDSVGIFRSSDTEAPFYSLGQIEKEARNSLYLRNLPVAFDSAVPFFPSDRSLLEVFGPTARFVHSSDPAAVKNGRQGPGSVRYDAVRVMAQPFLKRLTCFHDIGGYAYIYGHTNIDLIAALAEAIIPTEDLAKALLKNEAVLERLFPDSGLHTDMIFRYPGQRVAFHSIIGTRGDGTFRYPGGGMVWRDSGPADRRKVADNTYPDILSDHRSALVLVKAAEIAVAA